MRRKPKPPPSALPVRLDLSDLEDLVKLFPGSTMSLETRNVEFDGVEDIEKNLHSRVRIVDLTLTIPVRAEPGGTTEPGKTTELSIVPYLLGEDDQNEVEAYQYLLPLKRRVWWWAVLYGAIATVLCYAFLRLVMSLEQALAIEDTKPSLSSLVFVSLLMGASVAALSSRVLGSVLVPMRRGPTVVQRRVWPMAKWVGAVVLGGVISQVIRILFGS